MRLSFLFTKTAKIAPKDDVSVNAQLLIRAGYIDKLMAGAYTLLPLGLRVYKKIEQIIREEMDAIGGQEVVMPTLQPKERWQATGRYDGLDVLFRFTSHYSQTDYVLGPTHEEVIAPLMQRFVMSYKDLPKAAYHIQNKFRDEKRPKSGLLRAREFVMKDLYSFHADQPDLDRFYEQAKAAYLKVYERCGVGGITVLTYASGGTFSKYSHEFQTLAEAGEDTVFLCEACHVAVNREIIDDLEHKCPQCGNAALKEVKAIEVGNIFKLGTKYSAPFNLNYTDEQGAVQPVIMGCYGIGLQRLLATVVEASHDERGIIWPEPIAPYRVHLVSLKQNQAADRLYDELKSAGIEVLYDDREDVAPGEKFADADLIGCPWRVLVSEKTLAIDSVELKARTSRETVMVKTGEIIKRFKD